MVAHRKAVTVKMHEQMFDFITDKAKTTYRSNAEYIRQLIVDDMERDNGHTRKGKGQAPVPSLPKLPMPDPR